MIVPGYLAPASERCFTYIGNGSGQFTPWTVPQEASFVCICAMGAGGGGGGGGTGASSSAKAGGGGGGSGSMSTITYPARFLPKTIYLYAPDGGAGGAAQTAGATPANTRVTTYPDSAQVSLVLALASAGGGGGAATGNTAGTGTAGGAAPSLSNTQLSAFAIAANFSTAGSSGTAGGSGTTPSAGTNVQYLAASTSVPFTGGAGGGGSSSVNAVANGGAVNAVSTSNIFWSNSTTIIPGGAGVAGSTINGNSGWSNINPLDHTNSIKMPYYSLGGSGAPGAATVVGGVGGSGGIGSGGGGGGSGTTGGAGGNGGAGAIIITWW